jgi:hypothetical protein
MVIEFLLFEPKVGGVSSHNGILAVVSHFALKSAQAGLTKTR